MIALKTKNKKTWQNSTQWSLLLMPTRREHAGCEIQCPPSRAVAMRLFIKPVHGEHLNGWARLEGREIRQGRMERFRGTAVPSA